MRQRICKIKIFLKPLFHLFHLFPLIRKSLYYKVFYGIISGTRHGTKWNKTQFVNKFNQIKHKKTVPRSTSVRTVLSQKYMNKLCLCSTCSSFTVKVIIKFRDIFLLMKLIQVGINRKGSFNVAVSHLLFSRQNVRAGFIHN